MDSKWFWIVFFYEFVPSVTKFLKKNGLPITALLLVDNAPSHMRTKKKLSKLKFCTNRQILDDESRHFGKHGNYRRKLSTAICIGERECSILES